MYPKNATPVKGVLYLACLSYFSGSKVRFQLEVLPCNDGKALYRKAPSSPSDPAMEVIAFIRVPRSIQFEKVHNWIYPPDPGSMYLLLDGEGTYLARCESFTVTVDGLTVEWVGVIEGMKEPTRYWKIPGSGF